MRAEQRWSGLAAGVIGRIVRFASGLTIVTLCMRSFGAEHWGTAAIALAAVDLLTMLDFAVPELCVYEAAKTASPSALAQRLGQALWLLVPPIVLGTGALWLGAELAGTVVFRAQRAHASTLGQLLFAGAASYPFLLLANAYAGTLQGLGRLREMNTVHALSGLLELAVVIGLVLAGRSLIEVQWGRAATQALRCAIFALPLVQLGLPVPRLGRPRRAELRAMARYCLGFSAIKALGTALYRANVPLAQAFTSAARLGAYDAVDRLGSVLQRAANPVWDSLFQRLVRAFSSGASADEQRAGRTDFLAGTSLLVALSACATLGTVSLAPWLFPLWLGDVLASEPIAFAPWVLATWALNLTASMCTAVLCARGCFALCGWVHALALAVNVAAIRLLGALDGRLGLLAGPLIGNATLLLGLAMAGCRIAGVPFSKFAGRVLAIWAPALAAFALQAAFARPALTVALALTAAGCVGVLLVTRAGPELRALAAEFRARA